MGVQIIFDSQLLVGMYYDFTKKAQIYILILAINQGNYVLCCFLTLGTSKTTTKFTENMQQQQQQK